MGRAKEMMLELESEPMADVPDRLVSAYLFKNRLVHEYVFKHGFDGLCSYCGDYTKVLPLKSIVEFIDNIILKYFGDASNEGLGWDSHLEEDIPGFHQEGGGYIVPNSKPYYEDMRELLFESGFRVDADDLEKDIADALSYHNALIEQDPYGLNEAEERWVDWRIIKEKAIDMAQEGKTLDAMVKKEAARLDYLRGDIYTAQYPLQVEKDLTLYRTVNYKTKRRPLLFRDLTSPPTKFTRDLRMSKKGDSVFYGAESKDTAMKEALSDENDVFTYLGKFKTKHKLHLLDLTGIPEDLSIFDQEQYLLLLFLKNFCEAISEYVPDHDAIKYAPTQLVTYYFRTHLRHYDKDRNSYPLDGILYTSSIDGTMNAVLFYDNKGSRNHFELLRWQRIHKGQITRHTYPEWMKYIESPLAYIRRFWMN